MEYYYCEDENGGEGTVQEAEIEEHVHLPGHAQIVGAEHAVGVHQRIAREIGEEVVLDHFERQEEAEATAEIGDLCSD